MPCKARAVLQPPNWPVDRAGRHVTSLSWLFAQSVSRCIIIFYEAVLNASNLLMRCFIRRLLMSQLIWWCPLHVQNKFGWGEILVQLAFNGFPPVLPNFSTGYANELHYDVDDECLLAPPFSNSNTNLRVFIVICLSCSSFCSWHHNWRAPWHRPQFFFLWNQL